LIGAFYEFGTNRIRLDIPAKGQKVVVFRNGKALEPPLVKVAA
jgi:hypothetical protein